MSQSGVARDLPRFNLEPKACSVAAEELYGKDTPPLPSTRQLCPRIGGKGMERGVNKVRAGNRFCKALGAGQSRGQATRRDAHIVFPQNPGEPRSGIGPKSCGQRRAGSGPSPSPNRLCLRIDESISPSTS